MPNSKMHLIQMASSLFEHVDILEGKEMVGILHRKDIPESYKFVERQVIFHYNLEIYKNDESYIVNVVHLGLFQVKIGRAHV